jgi:hypothetical protein
VRGGLCFEEENWRHREGVEVVKLKFGGSRISYRLRGDTEVLCLLFDWPAVFILGFLHVKVCCLVAEFQGWNWLLLFRAHPVQLGRVTFNCGIKAAIPPYVRVLVNVIPQIMLAFQFAETGQLTRHQESKHKEIRLSLGIGLYTH